MQVKTLENDVVLEFKCTNCGCVNVCWPDKNNAQYIIENGVGLLHMRGCVKGGKCPCHYLSHPIPPRILMRETTLKDISERAVVNV